MVRSRVGNRGGMYIVNRPNTPEANPTSGNHSIMRLRCPWTAPKLPHMARNPMANMAAMARR